MEIFLIFTIVAYFKMPIFNLWLSCHTQQEIAESVGLSEEAIKVEIGTFRKNGNISENTESRLFQDANLQFVAGLSHATRNCRGGWGFSIQNN